MDETVQTPVEGQQVQTPEAKAPEVVQTPAEPVVPASGITPPVVEPTVLDGAVEEDGVVVYEATGDAGLDVALTFLGGLGLNSEDPAMVAAASGQFALLEAKLATMGDKATGWPQMLALAKDAIARSNENKAQQVAKVDKVILEAAGGAEAWGNVLKWASDVMSPEEKAAANAMIDGGNTFQARAVVALLTQQYEQASGTVVNPASALTGNTGGEMPNGNAKLSADEYAAAVRDLHAKMGSRMEGSQEYRDLQRRLRAR